MLLLDQPRPSFNSIYIQPSGTNEDRERAEPVGRGRSWRCRWHCCSRSLRFLRPPPQTASSGPPVSAGQGREQRGWAVQWHKPPPGGSGDTHADGRLEAELGQCLRGELEVGRQGGLLVGGAKGWFAVSGGRLAERRHNDTGEWHCLP